MSSGNTSTVDVRFFGAHDRAWIPVSQCYLLSEECPIPAKNLKKHGLDKAMEELNHHVRLLKEKFGEFKFAPFKAEFKPEHLYNCPILFGGAEESIMRPRPRPPSNSSTAGSVAASSDLSGSQDLETNFREDSVSSTPSRKKLEEKKSVEELPGHSRADSTVVNGVFTLSERLENEVSSRKEHLEECSSSSADSVTEKGSKETELDSLSCLERIRNSLRGDLNASSHGNSTGESDVNSEGEESVQHSSSVLDSNLEPRGGQGRISPGRARMSVSCSTISRITENGVSYRSGKMGNFPQMSGKMTVSYGPKSWGPNFLKPFAEEIFTFTGQFFKKICAFGA